MPLTLALTEAHSEIIGVEPLQKLIDCYVEAFPDLNLLADVVIVKPEEMQEINHEQRSIDEPTDVLSFPTLLGMDAIRTQSAEADEPTLIGSIIICPEKVADYDETMIQMVHHGLVHLLGYDHDTDFPAWMSEEKRILDIFERHQLFIPPVPYESV
jgi:probable rRNA maturation factor